jgi:uracil phosphoribosyltransferase
MQEKSLFVLNQHPSVANHFLSELRTIGIQEDRMRFRRNLERIGEVLAYEISKTFDYQEHIVETPLRTADVLNIKQTPVLISVLRAGLPMHQGLLNYFDQADCGFVGAFREHEGNEDDFDIALKYLAIPDIDQKNVILIDPMLATGSTLVKVGKELSKQAKPKHIHIASAIASPEGLAYLRAEMEVVFSLWLGGIDDHLNSLSYIVPGLGDAGDLAYGPKI